MIKNSFFLVIISLFTCNNATDNSAVSKELALIDRLKRLDRPMPKPKMEDWLFEHKEAGQTFEQYQKASPVMPNDTQNCLYIQPIGVFTEGESKIIDYTANYISTFFNLKTVVLTPISDKSIPAKHRRMNAGTEQLQTTYILDSLLNGVPKNALATMAITEKDLYPSASWNFVFGIAYTHKKRAVSSLFRYKMDDYGQLNETVCLERLIKTSAHEITHTFTCLHCIHAQCVMNGSNNMPESDATPNALCSDCLKKLSLNLGFDNRKRLTDLKAFYQQHGLMRDYKTAAASLDLMR